MGSAPKEGCLAQTVPLPSVPCPLETPGAQQRERYRTSRPTPFWRLTLLLSQPRTM